MIETTTGRDKTEKKCLWL